MTKFGLSRRAIMALALLPTLAVSAQSQTFPDRQIKLVVPFPAGGATDTAARLVARGMSTVLKQTVIIENIGGAGGSIATKSVVNAPADGYTVLAGGASSTFATMPLLYKLDFDPSKVLTPVALTTVDPSVLVVNAEVPVKSVKELIAMAKADPGKLNYGSSIGIGPHFVAELFKHNAGVDIVHVPYRGGGPMITDLVAGQIQMTVNGKSVLLPHIQSGKVRALAVAGGKRWKELPDVPTLMELGLLDASFDSFFGMVVPAGTPPAVIETLNRAVNEGMKVPEVAEGLAKLGIEANPGSVKDFQDFIAAEIPRWKKVMEITKIRIGN